MRVLSEADMAQVFPHARPGKIRVYLPWINAAMEACDIVTPARQSAFLAQVGHESGQLNYVREIYSGEAYDVGDLAERLGNTREDDGDGERFRGRGLIQITGKDNYRACSLGIFGDENLLLEEPEMLEEPKYAALSAGWYWQTRGLNELADRGEFTRITRRINGGVNGLKERTALWDTARFVLQV